MMQANTPIAWSLPEGIAEQLAERLSSVPDETLIVLPARLDPLGGLYPDVQLTSVKELRALGVRAEFLHPPDQRLGLSEFSAEVVYAFAVGIASNMTWDTAKAVWQYILAQAVSLAHGLKNPVVRLDVARVRRPGLDIEGLSLTAPATDSNAEAFLRLLVGGEGKEENHESGDRENG